jgi:predicted amidophosphoribosyltransferase
VRLPIQPRLNRTPSGAAPGRGQNRDIVVLDDVVTSGASLMYAREYLLAAAADSVSYVAIAKAIGNQ